MSEEVQNVETTQEKPVKKNTMVGFILGLIGIIAWIIPLLGFPITITGLVYSIREMKHEDKKGLAIAGLVLNIVFLVITVINSALGAYLGATGRL